MKNLNQKEHFSNIFHPDIRIACLLYGAIKPPVHLGTAHRPRLPPLTPPLLSMRKGNTEAALECNVYILNFGRFLAFCFGLWCFTVVNSFDNRRKARREEEMADEAPFQFLHQEMIQYIYKSNDQGEVRTWIRFLLPGIISYHNTVTMSNSHSLRKVEEISPN